LGASLNARSPLDAAEATKSKVAQPSPEPAEHEKRFYPPPVESVEETQSKAPEQIRELDEAAPNEDLSRQLKELAELHAGGDLTDQEFQQAKKKLLEQES
jgi:Short C-terminal domain